MLFPLLRGYIRGAVLSHVLVGCVPAIQDSLEGRCGDYIPRRYAQGRHGACPYDSEIPVFSALGTPGPPTNPRPGEGKGTLCVPVLAGTRECRAGKLTQGNHSMQMPHSKTRRTAYSCPTGFSITLTRSFSCAQDDTMDRNAVWEVRRRFNAAKKDARPYLHRQGRAEPHIKSCSPTAAGSR